MAEFRGGCTLARARALIKLSSRRATAARGQTGLGSCWPRTLASAWHWPTIPTSLPRLLTPGAASCADTLRSRGIPFLFYTGHDRIDGEFATAPVIRKPAPPADVVECVKRLLTWHRGDDIQSCLNAKHIGRLPQRREKRTFGLSCYNPCPPAPCVFRGITFRRPTAQPVANFQVHKGRKSKVK
jgi:hypothetical protein